MKNSLIWYFLLSLFFLQAQDQVFLNSNQSLVHLNPSFAGSNGLIRNQTSYRNMFPGLSGRRETILNCFDAYIKPIKGGIAFTQQQDDFSYGTLKQNSIGMAYAQHLSFKEGDLKIIPSVQVTYVQRVLDINALNYGDRIDPNTDELFVPTGFPIRSSRNYLSFASGVLINYKNKLYAGATIFNLNQPDYGLLGARKLPFRLSAHASYMLEISASNFVQFYGRYTLHDLQRNLCMGANLLFLKRMIAGAGYISNRGAAAINIGYRGNWFSVVTSYDFVTSKLAGNTNGGFELHFVFSLRNKENRRPESLLSFESW